MEHNKGGAPSIIKKKQDKELQALGLFNRDSAVYLTIESELEALTPARAFDLFCHYCARRATPDAYKYSDYAPERQKARVFQRKGMLMKNLIFSLPGETFSPSQLNYRKKLYDFSEALKKLYSISEHAFITYMDLLYLDYTTSHNPDDLTTNNFSFDITASFSWGYISHYYSEEQKEKIYEHIFNEHLQQSEELREIYGGSSDQASVKALHTLLILNNQRVAVPDVTDNIKSPFYLEDRTLLESVLKIDRYKDMEYAVSERPPLNSSRPLSYHPNATIHLNMDKPIDYIQEMLFALKADWLENNSFLGIEEKEEEEEKHDLQKLREDVMSCHKLQKTLAGKLTDLLYIYDCRRFYFTIPWVTEQIHRYWKRKIPKGKHGDTMSTSTYANYRNLINTMIDQRYYKKY